MRNFRKFWLLEGTKRGRGERMKWAVRQEPRHIGPCRPKKVDLYFVLNQGFIIVSMLWTYSQLANIYGPLLKKCF